MILNLNICDTNVKGLHVRTLKRRDDPRWGPCERHFPTKERSTSMISMIMMLKMISMIISDNADDNHGNDDQDENDSGQR